MKKREKKGSCKSFTTNIFTLVELLVVIAIIAILAGMLLPALNQARQYAKSASCINNLKSVNMALLNYADDFDDYTLAHNYNYFGNENRTNWVEKLCSNKYIAEKYRAGNPLANSILRCAAESEDRSTSLPATHFGINRALRSVYADMSATGKSVWKYNTDHGLIKVSTIKAPSAICSFADAYFDTYAIDYVSVLRSTSPFPDFRHQEKANFSFFDGHVATLKLNDVYYNTARSTYPKSPWYYTTQ